MKLFVTARMSPTARESPNVMLVQTFLFACIIVVFFTISLRAFDHSYITVLSQYEQPSAAAVMYKSMFRSNESKSARPNSVKVTLNASSWNRTNILGKDGNSCCRMKQTYFSSPVQFCIRNYTDIVSDQIAAAGRWGDCDAVSSAWFSPHPDVDPQDGDILIDVGSNIGACLVQVLAQAKETRAIAVEPSSANLFYLTQTLLSNPSIAPRVDLLPFALGSETAALSLGTEPDNAGHTYISPYTNGPRASVRPLDEIILPPYPPIRVMKIDVEGYESHVLRGAAKLLSSGAVRSLYFELSDDFLLEQGSSRFDLLSIILSHNYVIIEMELVMYRMRDERLQYFACDREPSAIDNFYAILANDARSPPQRISPC